MLWIFQSLSILYCIHQSLTWQVLFSIPPSFSIICVYINALLGRYILLAVIEGTAHVTRHGITARVALRLTSHGASLEQPV